MIAAPPAMFRTVDLKSVGIAVSDPEPAAAAFRKNFDLPVTRQGAGAEALSRVVSLGIGPGEIEVLAPTAEGSAVARFLEQRGAGLYNLVLVVDDLVAAVKELSERGIEVSSGKAPDGQQRAVLSPAHTHGARLVLVEAGRPSETESP